MLRAALLSALLPSFLVTPAHAADPGILVCGMTQSVAGHQDVCDFYDPSYDVIKYTTCVSPIVRGVPGIDDPNNRNTYVFSGALLGGRFVNWSRAYCRIGSAVSSEEHTGQYGYMVAGTATGPVEEAAYPVCTKWAVRFDPGNPRDYDPALTYWTDEYCG